jgi:hypothetical protein
MTTPETLANPSLFDGVLQDQVVGSELTMLKVPCGNLRLFGVAILAA